MFFYYYYYLEYMPKFQRIILKNSTLTIMDVLLHDILGQKLLLWHLQGVKKSRSSRRFQTKTLSYLHENVSFSFHQYEIFVVL